MSEIDDLTGCVTPEDDVAWEKAEKRLQKVFPDLVIQLSRPVTPRLAEGYALMNDEDHGRS